MINKDKDRLNTRRNRLEGVEVPLRDQVVKKLYNKLVEKNAGELITQAWHLESSNLSPHLDRQQIYLKDLDSWVPNNNEAPFSGSSNLHLPMTFIVSKTFHARFLQAILGVDPPFSVQARREDGVDDVQLVEDFMRFTLADWMNYNHGADEVVDQWVWKWITTGTGILKSRWHTEYTKYMDVQSVPEQGVPQTVINPETGEEELEPTLVFKEREVPVTLERYKGPIAELVDLEDFRLIGGQDPDTADMVLQRTWFTASDLWSMVDQKMVNEDVVEEIINGGRAYKTGSDHTTIKNMRATMAGKAAVDTHAELDRYEIIEAFVKMDVDDSGINSDVVMWVHTPSSKILRATYLHRIMPSGQRPFTVVHFHKRPGEAYGVGLPEIMHPLSVELDAQHNMRIDYGTLTNMPYFFYRASSSLDPEILSLEPGAGIPVDNPQTDVYFPNISNRTAFGAQEEASVMQYIEKLTGISDLNLGVMTGVQGATRTASGVRAILGESNSNLDVHLRRLNRGWKKFLHILYEMLKNRADPSLVFSVAGHDGNQVFRQVYDPKLLPDVDFILSANSANSNKAVAIETAQQLVQITSNPLYIQLGIVNANNAYNALKTYISAINVKDIHRYINAPSMPTFLLTPEEEFMRLIKGQRVEIQPQADHAGFIAYATSVLDNQQNNPTLNQEQIQLVASQMRAHEEMQQALEAQQAQAAMQQQMQLAQNAGAPELGAPGAPQIGLPEGQY